MPTASQTFAGADTDSADETRSAARFVAGLNLHLSPGSVFPATGNVAVAGYAPPATGITTSLGGFADGATGTAVELHHHSAGAHRLVRYDPAGNGGAGSRTLLLEWSGLALSATLLLQGGVLDGLLVYLDANGAVRSVSLQRALDNEYTPARLLADPLALHLVKRPPSDAPTAVRFQDGSTPVNLIARSAYQFATRYRYPDGEVSVLSPFSAISPVPGVDVDNAGTPIPSPLNRLRVRLSGSHPPLAQALEVLVRVDGEGAWQLARRFERGPEGFPGQYLFAGVATGETLSAAEANKAHEVLGPCKVLVNARSRVLAADFVEGELTPAVRLFAQVTLLSTAIDPSAPTQLLFRVSGTITTQEERQDGTTYTDTFPFSDFIGLVSGTYGDPQSTYRYFDYNSVRGQYALRAGTGLLTYANAFPASAPPRLVMNPVEELGLQPIGEEGSASTASTANPTFHARSTYRVGLQFYTALNQPYGVSGAVDVAIPAQPNMADVQARRLAWQLEAGAGAEIPAAAASYQLVLTVAQDVRFFVAVEGVMSQFRGDALGGQPQLQPAATTSGASATKALWVDISALGRGAVAGGGYLFAPGSNDRLRFLAEEGQDYPILYQRGDYVAVARRPGGLSNDPVPVEIYTPSLLPDTFFYERGPRYAVLRPPAPAPASYSITSGYLDGDAFVRRVRNNANGVLPLALEGMFPDAAGPTPTWLTMRYGGRAALEIPRALQRVHRPTLLRFSGVKVAGTQLNGLSQWEALNQYDELPQELGAVTRLSVADQTQQDGSVLVANQERGETSLYLGQQPIQASADTQLIAITKQVIGGANTLRGGFGCAHPATVVGYAGKLFWWSAERAELVRYNNGLTPLGLAYQFRRRLQALARTYAGGRVSGCFDPRRQEYWLTFQPTATAPLPTSVIWSERREAWADEVSWWPTAALGLGNELLTWQGASLYRHLPTAPVGTFGGVYTAPGVEFVAAQPGALLAKTWQALAVHSLARWVPTLLTTPTGQRSRILPGWMGFVRAAWRVAIRRDENSPGFNADAARALHNGRPLQSGSLRVRLSCPQIGPAPLVACEVDYLINAGQQPNQ